MDFLSWLQGLGKDASPAIDGFQASPSYIFVCVILPVLFGLIVGVGLDLIERMFGVELGKRGH